MRKGRAVLSVAFAAIALLARPEAAVLNVRDFGAKGNRKTNDRAAIQEAINACRKAGGGTVYFPPGDYLSGKLRLCSNLTLRLDAGATLWASTDPGHYENPRYDNLLYADNAQHISIVGPGTIHGQGTTDLGRGRGGKKRPPFRTAVMLFQNCHNITIRDLTILYSDAWTIHLKRCDTVFIDRVTILNNYYRTNSDGIDPNSSRNVHISNCHIVAGDDCIVLKATEPFPCENVVVTNCTLETIATALKLGTESRGDFRNIHFSNITIRNSPVGIGFYMKDGAAMERVTFSNIEIENCDPPIGYNFPIFMDIEKRNPDSRIGKIRDVTFRDIYIRSSGGILIQGMPQSAIENVTLQNVTIRADVVEEFSKRRKPIGGRRSTSDERDTLYARKPSYVTLAYVKGLTIDNIRVFIAEEVLKRYENSALSCNEVENAVIRNIQRSPAGGKSDRPIISLHNCRNMLVTGCMALHDTPLFLAVSGKRTARISLLGSDLRASSTAIRLGDEVPEGEIISP